MSIRGLAVFAGRRRRLDGSVDARRKQLPMNQPFLRPLSDLSFATYLLLLIIHLNQTKRLDASITIPTDIRRGLRVPRGIRFAPSH
jgi:hypothetical protein